MSRNGFAIAGLAVASWMGICSVGLAAIRSPEQFPSTVVAFVRGTPPRFSTISLRDFHHGMAQWAAERGLRSAPEPGDRGYERAKNIVVTDKLERSDIEGQAQEMGIVATTREVTLAVASVKRKNFKDHADYIAFLRESHYTRSDVFEAVKIQLLGELIEGAVLRGIEGRKARHAAMSNFVAESHRRWRPRNICAPHFVVAICSQ